ncbi:MAG: hypothetical protein F6K56_08940 [Moorea sp. SIO3G5]|nr:hypothetical protein [Moorena sp. SIO3G5]
MKQYGFTLLRNNLVESPSFKWGRCQSQQLRFASKYLDINKRNCVNFCKAAKIPSVPCSLFPVPYLDS